MPSFGCIAVSLSPLVLLPLLSRSSFSQAQISEHDFYQSKSIKYDRSPPSVHLPVIGFLKNVSKIHLPEDQHKDG